MYRAMGSLAFVATARAAYCVTNDKDDLTRERRFFLPIKNNLGNDHDGLACRLEDGFSANRPPVVKWEATPVSVSADEALNDDGPHEEEDTSELDEAKTWLADTLAAGPVAAEDIYAKAKDDGIAKRTFDRAKKDLKVAASKAKGVANGPWSWSMGEGCQQERQDPGQGNLGDVGNLGNLPEKPKENGESEGPEIEGCQGDEGCQSAAKTEAVAPLQSASAGLDPDRPGPLDLLPKDRLATYKAVYYSRPASMSPSEKHARAWKAALRVA
jgi:hypothetical protein